MSRLLLRRYEAKTSACSFAKLLTRVTPAARIPIAAERRLAENKRALAVSQATSELKDSVSLIDSHVVGGADAPPEAVTKKRDVEEGLECLIWQGLKNHAAALVAKKEESEKCSKANEAIMADNFRTTRAIANDVAKFWLAKAKGRLAVQAGLDRQKKLRRK